MNRFIIVFLAIILSQNLFSQNIDSLIKEAISLKNQGEYRLAITAFENALKINKNSSEVNLELANIYITSNNYKKALKYCNWIIRNNLTGKAKAYLIKGSVLDYMGKPNRSIRVYKQAILNYPNDYLLHFNLGITYHNRNKINEAESEYIHSIEISPIEPSSHYMLGVVMSQKGERLKSMLALYYFLLLEPDTERSIEAIKLLLELWKQNIEFDPANPSSTKILSSKNKHNASLDIEISSIFAKSLSHFTPPIDEFNLLVENTKSLLAKTEIFKDSLEKGIWEKLYFKFYSDLAISNQIEAFSYYTASSCDNSQINGWLETNREKISSFSTWVNKELKLKPSE